MNILIITSAKYPEGDAESVRLHTFGKLLRDIGNHVYFVGMGYSNYLECLEYDGFQYTSLRKKAGSKFQKIYFYINYKKRLESFLNSHFRCNKVDVILIADLPTFVTNWLKDFCSFHSIDLIVDSVEWFSPGQFKMGLLSPGMILKNIENRYVIDKKVKVIAISKYLESHFINKGCIAVRIPVILDVMNLEFNKVVDPRKLTVLYAGSPGKKDYVPEMLRGVLLLTDREKAKINFIFAGVSIDDIKKLFSSEEIYQIKKCVEFLGRIEREKVLKLLAQADFTILLRSQEQRYAKAGFPTKVVESLATATPVMLNITSDLGDYINDMSEGIIIKDCTATECASAIKRAISLDYSQREFMKKNARLCAETNFDYRLYEESLKILFTEDTK
ncbi:glycosyltransferase family 4 protein [Bacillus sp. DNRA2]|uniref:glycosyltransferase n=1 Tax=Bacillus sp. DNRA2 TaxID=2723053 RepID=UPI00145D640A|nr:glycosyltransferase [Bacillus sp. DNRA2]NMD70175.1 glycosyltransferase family 4 protein [Bacillus sp. DNRA2]